MKTEELQVSYGTRPLVRHENTLIGCILILPWIYAMFDLGYALMGLRSIYNRRPDHILVDQLLSPHTISLLICTCLSLTCSYLVSFQI